MQIMYFCNAGLIMKRNTVKWIALITVIAFFVTSIGLIGLSALFGS